MITLYPQKDCDKKARLNQAGFQTVFYSTFPNGFMTFSSCDFLKSKKFNNTAET